MLPKSTKVCFFIACTCSNNLVVSSTCLALQYQPFTMGEYQEVCMQDDNTVVYMNIDHADKHMYLYRHAQVID